MFIKNTSGDYVLLFSFIYLSVNILHYQGFLSAGGFTLTLDHLELATYKVSQHSISTPGL